MFYDEVLLLQRRVLIHLQYQLREGHAPETAPVDVQAAKA